MEEARWEGASRAGVEEGTNMGALGQGEQDVQVRTVGSYPCPLAGVAGLIVVTPLRGPRREGEGFTLWCAELGCLREASRSHEAAGWAAGRAGREEAGAGHGR